MKKITYLILLLSIMQVAHAQVKFIHINSEEDMEAVWQKSDSLNKPVFVDIYATWCGPCKWMDANVFASSQAGWYMNDEFINVKMDGESEFGRVFALNSGLTAYPSFFLFNPEKKQMNMIMGAKPWSDLEPVLASTLEFFPILEMMQSKFESNLLERDEYPRFAKALSEMGKEDYGEVVAQTYREKYITEDPLTQNDIRVLASYIEYNTDLWNRITSDVDQLKDALGSDYENFINETVSESIILAVEEQDIAYIRSLNEMMPELTKDTELDAEEIQVRSNVYYYHYSEMFEELIHYVDSGYKSREGDHKWLFEAASNAVFLDPLNTTLAEKGLEWFKTCVKLDNNYEYYFSLGLCQYYAGKPEETVKSLEKAQQLTDDQELINEINSIIDQVKAEIGEQDI